MDRTAPIPPPQRRGRFKGRVNKSPDWAGGGGDKRKRMKAQERRMEGQTDVLSDEPDGLIQTEFLFIFFPMDLHSGEIA